MGGGGARSARARADLRIARLESSAARTTGAARATREASHKVTMLAQRESIHDPSTDSGDVYALPARYHSVWGACQLVLKRLIDVIGATVGLVVLAPVFGVIALLVVVDSGLPIFFRWNVVGRRGRYFTGHKFRTMVQDAEAMQVQLANHNEMTGPVFKMRRDPRATRVGPVLRRYSLDELPQLWARFKADMNM